MKDWIDNEVVENALKNKSKIDLEKSGVQFCVSDDFKYCILIRRHSAWEIKKEGWRDANEAPKQGETSRWVLNFYKKGSSWFKMFVPMKHNITKIESKGKKFRIITKGETISGIFSSHDNLMWDVMTGNAEKETEIESKFFLISST
jgi:hypothetical protein